MMKMTTKAIRKSVTITAGSERTKREKVLHVGFSESKVTLVFPDGEIEEISLVGFKNFVINDNSSIMDPTDEDYLEIKISCKAFKENEKRENSYRKHG